MRLDDATDPADFHARHVARIRRQLLTGGLPIFALTPGPGPAGQRFSGLESDGAGLVAVQIVHGEPPGPHVEVETARIEQQSLRTALEHHVRLGGDRFADLRWSEAPATLRADDRPVPARVLRAGERWWAVRGDHDGRRITVVGHDWHPAEVAVATVTDLTPMLDRLAAVPDFVPWEPAPLPDDLRGEPHRALAEAVLDNAAEHRRWLAEGGPEPTMPSWWSALWQAAVHRQTVLSGESEAAAERAVSSMMSQLGTLCHEADWLRDDEDLRRRAVAEVLLYGTGIGTDVPSRAAQEAWERRSADGPVESLAEADQDWTAAWQRWAEEHRSPG